MKNKKNKSDEKTKRKILFYNVVLPILIYMILVACYIARIWIKNPVSKYPIYFTRLIIITFSILSAAPFLFWIFYPIYHFLYFIFTKLFSFRYYGRKISLIIFFTSAIIGGIGYNLYSSREVIEQELNEKFEEAWELQERNSMKKKCQEKTYLEQKEECLKNLEHLDLTEEDRLMLCDECYRKGI